MRFLEIVFDQTWDILFLGLFLEEAATVARKELSWEVDYEREAAYSAHFK